MLQIESRLDSSSSPARWFAASSVPGSGGDLERSIGAFSVVCTTRPRLMTCLITGPPTRMRSVSMPETITASICLPASRLPIVSCAIDRRRGVERGADQRLFERHVHAEAGQRHHERHRGREAAAGIEIGRERHRDALLDQHPRRRVASQLQEERRRRQQRRDDVLLREHAARAVRRRRSGDPPSARRLRRRRASRRSARARRRGCAASGRGACRPRGCRAIRRA